MDVDMTIHGFFLRQLFVRITRKPSLPKIEVMKKTVKNLMTAATFLVGTFFASQSSFGQVQVGASLNYLYMGFQNAGGGGTQDYVINLGPASGIVGGASVVTLSSDFSITDFNAVLKSSSSLYGGVVGGSNAGSPSDIYVTQLRTGGPGNPATPGSTLSATLSRSQDNIAYSDLTALNTPSTTGSGILDTSKTWETYVEAQPNPQAYGSFWSDSGENPDSTINKTTVLYEDLYYTSNSSFSGSQPFVYEGYFTLNLTGGSPVLTFTPKGAIGSLVQPVFVSVSKTGTTTTLVSSNAVATHTYQLQYSTTLSPASWSSIGSAVTAGGTMVTNTDTTATNSARFYQIQAN